MTNSTTVKFNSATAERRVKSYSREIGQLRTRIKSAATAQDRFGKSVKSGTADINHMSRRIRVLTRDMDKFSKSTRTARKDVLGLARAMSSAGMKRAAGTIAAASRPLRRVSREADRASTSTRRYGRSMDRAGRASLGYSRRAARAVAVTGRVERVVRNADRSFLGLAASMVRVRNLAFFLAAGFGVQPIIEMADAYKLVGARLAIVTDSTEQLMLRQEELFRISERTRSSYRDNAALFVKLAQAGEQYGVTQEKALIVTENVSRAMKISGASASEARAATQQLAQAFASGRIQGDELRSVLENSPRIAKALSTELADLGVNLGNIRELASEGRIGIAELVRALGGASISKQLEEEFAQIPLTIGDALVVAQNKITRAIGEFDAVTGATDKLAQGIVFLAENIDTLGRIIAVVGVVKLGQMVASLGAGSRALLFLNRGLSGSRLGMAAFAQTVTVGATSLLRFLGPIGLAITALELMDRNARRSEIRMGELSDQFGDTANTAGQYLKQAQDARIAQENLARAQRQSVPAAQQLANVSSELREEILRLGLTAQWTALQVTAAFRAEKYSAFRSAQSDFQESQAAARRAGTSQTRSADAVRLNSYFDRQRFERAQIEYQDAVNAEALARQAFQDARNGVNDVDIISPPVEQSGGRSRRGLSEAERRRRQQERDRKDSIRAVRQMQASFSEAERTRQRYEDGIDTLDTALARGVLTQENYNVMVRDLARNIFPGVAEQIADVTAENERLQASLDGESSLLARFREDTEPLRQQLEVIDQIIAIEGDKTGELVQQRDLISRQVEDYADVIAQNQQLVELTAERRREEEFINRLVDEAANRLYETLTDSVSDALDFNTDSFKKFFKSILGFAKDTFANVISAYVFRPIQEELRQGLEGALSGRNRRPGSRRSNVTAQDIIQNGFRINNGLLSGASNDNEIMVEAEIPKGFLDNFILAYRGVWADTFSDLTSLLKPFVQSIGNLVKDLGIDLGGLGKTLGAAFGGAQLGSQVAGLGKILGLNTSTTGGAIGGAIGSVVPIPGGSIIGSIAGSLLGGLFGSKSGSATITGLGSGAISTDGGSKSRRNASVGLAGGIQESLQRVADELGGTVGGFRVSIGVRKDDFRVDPTGRGETKTKRGAIDFGQDQQAAVEFAVKEAIRQGAIQGLRASTSRLLQGASSIDQGVQDALDFESVFARIEETTDPAKAAINALNAEFEDMIDLFRRAGASTEEWSQLGDLFRTEMDQLLEDQLSGLRAFRDDLLGGDASFRSSTDRLRIADERFREFEGRISAGESVDQDEFVAAGQELQALARTVFGSTPEFQAFQRRLIDSTTSLIDNIENDQANFQGIIDAIDAQTSSTNAAISVTNEYLRQLAQGIGRPILSPIGVPIAGNENGSGSRFGGGVNNGFFGNAFF